MWRVFCGLSLILIGIFAYLAAFRYVDGRYEKAEETKKQIASEFSDVSVKPKEVQKETEPVVETGVIDVVPMEEKEAITEFQYYLVEEFGFVNIYLPDKKTIYEFTDIRIEALPQSLQDEICTGKGLTGEQELYDFLENYSS